MQTSGDNCIVHNSVMLWFLVLPDLAAIPQKVCFVPLWVFFLSLFFFFLTAKKVVFEARQPRRAVYQWRYDLQIMQNHLNQPFKPNQCNHTIAETEVSGVLQEKFKCCTVYMLPETEQVKDVCACIVTHLISILTDRIITEFWFVQRSKKVWSYVFFPLFFCSCCFIYNFLGFIKDSIYLSIYPYYNNMKHFKIPNSYYVPCLYIYTMKYIYCPFYQVPVLLDVHAFVQAANNLVQVQCKKLLDTGQEFISRKNIIK